MLWRNLTLTTWHFLLICNDEWWINPLDLVENIYLRWMNHYFSHDTFHCIKIYIKALDNYHSVYTSKSDFEIWGNLWGPYHWNFTNLRNFYAIFYFIDQPLSKENALEWKKWKGVWSNIYGIYMQQECDETRWKNHPPWGTTKKISRYEKIIQMNSTLNLLCIRDTKEKRTIHIWCGWIVYIFHS